MSASAFDTSNARRFEPCRPIRSKAAVLELTTLVSGFCVNRENANGYSEAI